MLLIWGWLRKCNDSLADCEDRFQWESWHRQRWVSLSSICGECIMTHCVIFNLQWWRLIETNPRLARVRVETWLWSWWSENQVHGNEMPNSRLDVSFFILCEWILRSVNRIVVFSHWLLIAAQRRSSKTAVITIITVSSLCLHLAPSRCSASSDQQWCGRSSSSRQMAKPDLLVIH